MKNSDRNPLSSLEDWEDDILRRYPDPEITKKKDEYRNYNDSDRDSTVREFYRLNHKYQTYDFVSGKEDEFSAIIDIAKATAEKEGWYPGRHGSWAPWDYEWSNGQAQELKDKRAREAEAVIKDIEAKHDNPDSVDPDANDDGQLSPDALRRIADKVEAGAEEKEEQPAPTMSKIDKLEALKKIDAEMKSGEIDDLEALRRMKALKGK